MKKSERHTPEKNEPINKKHKFKRFSHKFVRILADSPLPEVAFLASFILSRWWLNSDFSYPSEIWAPLIIFSILAIIIFYIYRVILGKGFAVHLAAILLSYCFYTYGFIHDNKLGSTILKILPGHFKTPFSESIVLALVLGILVGLLAYGLKKMFLRYKTLQNLQPYKIILFAVLFMLSIQIVRCGERYFSIQEELSYRYPAPNLPKPASANQKTNPDIYYLLFDRYGDAGELKKNFNYDNSDLMNFFSNHGFVNRDQAYANYPFTMSSVSSTMAMNYFPEFEDMFKENGDWQSAFPYRNILNNPPIAQVLKQNGYKYNQVSSWWDFTRLNIKANNNPTESFRLNVAGSHYYFSDLQRDIFNKSIFSPWLKKGIKINHTNVLSYDLDRNPQENFNSQMDALKNIANRADKTSPDFTFAHILAPHPPYVFNENGEWPSYDGEANDNGVDESVKYISELKYVNQRLEDMIKHIQKQSPNAVIVIQADEGPYPKQFRDEITADHYYNPLDLPLDKMQQKFGVLASYYMPGAPKDQVKEIKSSNNVFRFVLNNYLGYNLPMLPSCNFSMGNKFNIYDYTLVTDKLTGGQNPSSCKQYE